MNDITTPEADETVSETLEIEKSAERGGILLTYRVTSRMTNGTLTYGIGASEINGSRRLEAFAGDLTPCRGSAVRLMEFLLGAGVSACQLCDVIGDLLPVDSRETLALIGAEHDF